MYPLFAIPALPPGGPQIDTVAQALRVTGGLIQRAAAAVSDASVKVRETAFSHMGGAAGSSKALLRSAITGGVARGGSSTSAADHPATSSVLAQSSSFAPSSSSSSSSADTAAAHVAAIAEEVASGARLASPAVRSPGPLSRLRTAATSAKKSAASNTSSSSSARRQSVVPEQTPRIITKIQRGAE